MTDWMITLIIITIVLHLTVLSQSRSDLQHAWACFGIAAAWMFVPGFIFVSSML